MVGLACIVLISGLNICEMFTYMRIWMYIHAHTYLGAVVGLACIVLISGSNICEMFNESCDVFTKIL